MDVVVVGPRVRRVALQHRLEDGDDLLRSFGRSAVLVPQAPGAQVHQALGIQRGGVQVVRIAPRQLGHRLRIGAIQRGPVGGGIRRVARGQRPDIRGLRRARAPGQLLRLPDRLVGPGVALRVDWHVDVRPEGQGDTPEGHGAFGIEPGGFEEGALRLIVVEAEHESQPLVEIALRLVRPRRDDVMVRAEIVEQRDSGRRGRLLLRGARIPRVPIATRGGEGGPGQHEEEQDGGHRNASPEHALPPR